MRESNTLRYPVAVAVAVWCTVSTGCDVSLKQETTSKNRPASPIEAAQNQVGQNSEDALNVQGRESEDAGRLLDQIGSEQSTDDEQTDQENSTKPDDLSNEESTLAGNAEPEKQTIEIPATWKRLGKKEEIWIDTKAKEVIIAGRICLNQGSLEMFICPEHTKEHESIIAANATSLQVHLALTALGADPGKATSWDPEYRAAYGPTITIILKWRDKETQKTKSVSANQWIRDVKTNKAMKHLWVFGGSQFWEDPDSKEQVYFGDAGELVCLSNFSTATIDLNVESSQSNEGLLFEAFTENIPPLGTKVYAIIKPGKRIEPNVQTPKKADAEIADSNQGLIQGKTETAESKTEDK